MVAEGSMESIVPAMATLDSRVVAQNCGHRLESRL